MLMGTDMPALPMLVATKLVDHGQVEARAQKKAQEELEASDENGCPKSVETQEDVKYTRSEMRREYTDERTELKNWRGNTVLRCPPKS